LGLEWAGNAVTRSRWLHRTTSGFFLLLLVALLPGLGRPQLTLFDESFQAIVARRLLDHPFQLTLYDAPLLSVQATHWSVGGTWHHMPPVALWQMALSLALLGISTFALRLPSALLHVGAAFLTYRIGRDLFGSGTGTVAALLQALSPLLIASVYGFHSSGHVDLALLFWSEAALLTALRGARTGHGAWFAAAGLALGIAVLSGGVPALATAATLLILGVATRLGVGASAPLKVRPLHLLFALVVAAAVGGAWIAVSLAAGNAENVRQAAAWLVPRGIVSPRISVGTVADALPWLWLPAAGAMLIITARVPRHAGELFLAAWAWGGVLPLSTASAVSATAGVLGVPVLALALARVGQLVVERLTRAAWRRQALVTVGAIAAMLTVTALYARVAWKAGASEPPDDSIKATAARLRQRLPANAVFVLDEPQPTGDHLALMFWADRPVHSIERLRRRQPTLSPGIAGRAIRDAGGAPYLLTRQPLPGAPVPADTAGPYSVYPIGPTPTGAPALSIGNPSPALGWGSFGADPGGTRYSPLADIDRSNVAQLQPAWIWPTDERPWHNPSGDRDPYPGRFEVTPLMIGDTLYLTTPFHRLVALDAETGRLFWSFDPQAYLRGQPFGRWGFVHRGVATWTDGQTRRLLYASRGRFYAVNSTTGKLIQSFGRDGVVDLVEALGWAGNPDHLDNTSPPVVYRDLVIVGSSIGDEITYTGDPPGAVIAFDARTGRREWIFRTIPAPGEDGYETWGGGTHGKGHVNVWAPMTVDTARGLVFAPVGAAGNDWYGAARPGANLFSESLVALDARTGKRVWHFQTVHHGLWDYDLAAPPVLATVRQHGRMVDLVAAAGKTGFLYVFERATGRPVWPIVERPVPPSDVPGERASPTQPFPTWPKPFTRQGIHRERRGGLHPAAQGFGLEGAPRRTPRPDLHAAFAGRDRGVARLDRGRSVGWRRVRSGDAAAVRTRQQHAGAGEAVSGRSADRHDRRRADRPPDPVAGKATLRHRHCHRPCLRRAPLAGGGR
jgi:4-amino-4-deoxy-L-arabinose transferase-like glycosyltransferase/outer membrane protein assembly factor BamB